MRTLERCIRAAEPSDSGALTTLAKQWLHSYGYDADAVARSSMSDTIEITATQITQNRFWIAEQDGQVVGSIALAPQDGKTGQVQSYFVAPAFKRTGIGRLLWFRLTPIAQTQGFTQLSVLSDPHSIPFYESLGFVTQYKVPLPEFKGCEGSYMLFSL